jgi:type IV pilus biogenesis protein CpaD/CtpE
MKAMRQCLVIMVLANAMLTGCASNPTDHPPSKVQDVDTVRMAQIEAAARRAGVEIHWVNYPLKSQSQP